MFCPCLMQTEVPIVFSRIFLPRSCPLLGLGDDSEAVLGNPTLLFFELLQQVVGAVALVAGKTLDQRIAKDVNVA